MTNELAYMLFTGVGNGIADFAAGKGKDGTNCLVATGRTATWNGIALTVPEQYYGKGFTISFDASATSIKDGVTAMDISCTTKFQIMDAATGTASTVYPEFNRIVITSENGEWVHGEGTVYFPSDVYIDPENAGTIPQIYFESPTGKGKEDIFIDNINITAIDGVGDYAAFQKYWEEHAPVEEPTEE